MAVRGGAVRRVDADERSDALNQQPGKVNVDDPATTIALLKLHTVVGITASIG
jgi:hypothetical protein